MDENDTDGQYFHWRTDTANINGGFPVFELPACLNGPMTFIRQTIIACDSYTFNNVTYTESFSINDTLQDVNGCDSISMRVITITHPVEYYDNVQVCEGQSYTFNGRTLTGTGYYYDTITNGAANGCDSLVYLWLEVRNPNSWNSARVCEGQSYTFNGRTLTETGYYYDTIINGAANGCDSIVYLWLAVQNNYSYPSAEICQGENYSFAGQMLTQSGTYFDTLTNVSANGCDSIVQLNFTVHPSYYLYDTVYVPENSLQYLYTYRDWPQELDDFSVTMSNNTLVIDIRTNPSGTIYDNGGANSNYSDNFDGTIILTADEGESIKLSGNYHLEGCCDYLAVYDGYGTSGNNLLYSCGVGSVDLQSNTGYLTIRFTSDGSVNYDGFALQWSTRRAIDTLLTAAGDYTFEAHTSYGCDNTFNLHLEPRAAYSRTDSIAICSNSLPYAYADTLIADAGAYIFSYIDQYGIDSTVTLVLDVLSTSTADTSAVACDNFTWYGTAYTTSATPTHVFTNTAGCDSTVTLNLTVNNPVHTAITETACETYTWNGITYTATGNYTYAHLDAKGCTQVDTLHLTINTPVVTEVYDTACDSYSWYGTTYIASGDYQRTGTSALPGGCDTTETLHLTVNNPVHTATTETACETYTWNGTTYTATGDYTYSHTDANGCTQVDTLHLTINHGTTGIETVSACNSYVWHGTEYTASTDTPTYTSTNAAGCDSVTTLHLTINNPVHIATTQTVCESYTWNETNYSTSGTYTYTHADTNGCIQVDTLHLTINTPVATEVYYTACDSYSWHGTDYTASGDYQRTWPSALPGGCDTTETLHLTINHSTETTVADTAEESYTWNGTTYTESGTYTWTGTTVEGCDSTVTLQLVITQVGIEKVEENGVKVNVYPNPTSGLLTIDAIDILSVEVIDQAGRMIDTYKNTNHIDLGGIPAGSYLLKIHLLRGQSIQRVILK